MVRRRPDGHIFNQLEDEVGKWARQHKVTYLSLFDTFLLRKQKKPEPFYFWQDGHFNARGHEVLAEELAALVQQKYGELWRK